MDYWRHAHEKVLKLAHKREPLVRFLYLCCFLLSEKHLFANFVIINELAFFTYYFIYIFIFIAKQTH